MDERLLEYIREQLNQGFTADSIRQALIDEGWDPAEADEAIRFVMEETQLPQSNQLDQSLQYGEDHETPPQEEPIAQPEYPPEQPQGYAEKPLKVEKKRPAIERPMIVIIMSILGFAVSGLAIAGGSMIAFMGGMTGSLLGGISPLILSMGGMSVIFGGIMIALGAAGIFAFYMLFRMKPMGWILTMILGMMLVVLEAFSADPISMALWAVVIITLFLKRNLFV